MNSPFIQTTSSTPANFLSLNPNFINTLFLKPPSLPHKFSFKPNFVNRRHFFSSLNSTPSTSTSANNWNFVEIRNPNFNVPPFVSKFSGTHLPLFLFTFIAFTTSAALVAVVAAAVPTLHAMGRTANSLTKLADAAREELPSTMTAIRLSGMEISDLTLELSDLSQDISEGVNKSAQAVQAAENGIRQIGAFARKQTASIIEERANLPIISLQPVVSGAAKKTSYAVSYATKRFMNMISGREFRSDNKEDDSLNR